MANVLIIEDNAATAELMREALRNVGHAVNIARSCRAARSMARSFRPQVALLDLRLPDCNGEDLIDFLQEDEPPPAVVICTAFPECLECTEDERLAGVLCKPFPAAALVAKVDQALEARAQAYAVVHPL